MYNNDTELLFPSRLIPGLRELREGGWQQLVDRVVQAGPDSNENMAFALMMIRLNNCLTCHMDSFRAIRGCTHCSAQTVRRYRGTDEELFELYEKALHQVEGYINKEKL